MGGPSERYGQYRVCIWCYLAADESVRPARGYPPVGSKLTGNKIEQGSFPSSIRTDEPGNLALLDAAVHLMQCQQPAETFRYITYLKQLHRLPKRHPRRPKVSVSRLFLSPAAASHS